MPARLSFRRRRSDAVARPRRDAAQRLSFRARKPARSPARASGDLPRGLSFRRRPQRPVAARDPARKLSFRRGRGEAAVAREPSGLHKLALRLHRRRPEGKPRTEPDGRGLVLRLVAVGLVAGMLQLLVASQIVIGGVSADLTPLVVAAAGFICGSLAGAGFGFGLGLFVDLAFVQTLGVSSLLFTLIGYGAGRLRELRAPAAPLTRLLLGTVATATALGGYGAIEFMLGINTPVSTGLIGAIVETTVLNSLIAVPVYAVTRRVLLPALPDAERRPQQATTTTTGGLSPLSRA